MDPSRRQAAVRDVPKQAPAFLRSRQPQPEPARAAAPEPNDPTDGAPDITVNHIGGDDYEVTIGYRYIVYPADRPDLARVKYWPPFVVKARYAGHKVSKIGLGTCEVRVVMKPNSSADASCGFVFSARRDRVSLDAYGQAIWERL